MSYLLLITRRGYSQNFAHPIPTKLKVLTNLFRLLSVILIARLIVTSKTADYQAILADPVIGINDHDQLVSVTAILITLGFTVREFILYAEENGKFILSYSRISEIISNSASQSRLLSESQIQSNTKLLILFSKMFTRGTKIAISVVLGQVLVRIFNPELFSSSMLVVSSFWLIIEALVATINLCSGVMEFHNQFIVLLIYYLDLNSLNHLCKSHLTLPNDCQRMRFINYSTIKFFNELDLVYFDIKYTLLSLLMLGSLLGTFNLFFGLIITIVSVVFSKIIACGGLLLIFAGISGYLAAGFVSKVTMRSLTINMKT
ncbi:uncharacterized protein LOC128385732 [Panonychus citri]|uniref:uncharacterized protein LOC128385732 n=1 Tax=Panonychus citri TaxID=50023 RepID=UPI002307C6F9|nr:uncharacterized protein LOC128385732 [Panonychus citri]